MTLAELVLPPSQARRALIIAAVSVAVLAGAWTFQGLGYQPCELCLTQRYAFYAAAPLAALIALAAYHVGVEYRWWAGPTACTGGLAGSLDVNDLAKALDSVKVVRCDEVQLRIAGLSLAGWNVLASAALAVYAALAARL